MQYEFQSTDEYYQNWAGQNEKWIQDAEDNWYYLLSDGGLYEWSGDFESSDQIATLDESVYDDPSLLTDAEPVPVSIVLEGNQLTIQTPAEFEGDFDIRIIATDGLLTSEHTFNVEVSNEAPIIEPIGDQSVSAADGNLAVEFEVTDPDSEEHSFGVTIVNPLYELDQDHGFQTTEDYHLNWGGENENGFRSV